MRVNHDHKITMPIHDMHRDGEVVFCVDVYGLQPRDMALVPGGSSPMRDAVIRMRLDPNRYQAWIWDLPTHCDKRPAVSAGKLSSRWSF